MNIWATLKRILIKHFKYHMAVPLLVGATVEIMRLMHDADSLYVPTDITQLGPLVDAASIAAASLLNLEHALPIIAVIIAYLFVMFSIVTNEADIPFETANYTRVEQALRQATSYFALCDIPMREWYEPGAFKYFALLQATKIARGDAFRYERVMVFTTPGRRRDAEIDTLDRYHAEAFATAHVLFRIPMGWLGPKELKNVVKQLSDLTAQERSLFQRVPKGFRWLPKRLSTRIPWPCRATVILIPSRH